MGGWCRISSSERTLKGRCIAFQCRL